VAGAAADVGLASAAWRWGGAVIAGAVGDGAADGVVAAALAGKGSVVGVVGVAGA
jgi:hypothetical protein